MGYTVNFSKKDVKQKVYYVFKTSVVPKIKKAYPFLKFLKYLRGGGYFLVPQK